MNKLIRVYSSKDRHRVNRPLFSSEYHFSFGEWQHPDHMGFGALRVLNDDAGKGGSSIPLHPHKNFEILSILLKGGLRHIDDLGNELTVLEDGVKLMSAGSGLRHGGSNISDAEPFEMLQVWIAPNIVNTPPEVKVKQFDKAKLIGTPTILVSPDGEQGSLQIKQDAWITRSKINKGQAVAFNVHQQQNGLYLFCLQGEIAANDAVLKERWTAAITGFSKINVTAMQDADVIAFEIPV